MGGDIFHPKSHWIPDYHYRYPEIQLKVIQPFSHPTFYEKALPQWPHSRNLMTAEGGGGGDRMILLSLKFWPKVIFWETPGFFWVAEKKTKGFFGVAKKGQRDFGGYAKKG